MGAGSPLVQLPNHDYCLHCTHTQRHRKWKTKEPDSKQRDNNSTQRNGACIFQPDLETLSRQATMDGIWGEGLFIPGLTLSCQLPCFVLQFVCVYVCVSVCDFYFFSRLWLILWKTAEFRHHQWGINACWYQKLFFNILNYYCTEQTVRPSSWEH